jgi:trk system potassium uptake protein TrkA
MATALARQGHNVTIIDQNPDAFRRLKNYTGDTEVGNGLDPDVLRRAGIEQADVFVTVTNGDNRNITAAQIAQEIFKVPKVLARIYDPMRAAAYQELGLNTICTTMLGSGVIIDMILDKPLADVLSYLEVPLE